MGGGKDGGGSDIDVGKLTEKQEKANRKAAIASAELSMVGQNTPYGNLSFERTGTSKHKNPLYTATVELSPEQQALFNQQQQIKRNASDAALNQSTALGGLYSDPFNLDFLGNSPILDDEYKYSIVDNIISRHEPMLDNIIKNEQTRLANQGIAYGSEAYNDAMHSARQQLNDFYLGADAQADAQMLNRYNAQLAGRNQAINEAIQERSFPMQEIFNLLGQSQPMQPTFMNTPQTQVQPVDTTAIANMKNQMQQQAANRRAQMFGDVFGAAGGLGAAAILAPAASDIRVKRDIKRVGTLESGLPWYEFRYIWDTDKDPIRQGVMAQEALEVIPEAVIHGEILMVDYSRVY